MRVTSIQRLEGSCPSRTLVLGSARARNRLESIKPLRFGGCHCSIAQPSLTKTANIRESVTTVPPQLSQTRRMPHSVVLYYTEAILSLLQTSSSQIGSLRKSLVWKKNPELSPNPLNSESPSLRQATGFLNTQPTGLPGAKLKCLFQRASLPLSGDLGYALPDAEFRTFWKAY